MNVIELLKTSDVPSIHVFLAKNLKLLVVRFKICLF